MKKIFILLFFFLWSCETLTVNPPPEELISEEIIENIIYDQLLLRTMQSSRMIKDDSLNIFNEDFISRKYNLTDSILQQNLEYYAQYPKRMSIIYLRIEARFDQMLDSLEQLTKMEDKISEKKMD